MKTVLTIIGVIGVVALLSLVVNFIAATVVYLIAVKALGFGLSFWQTYWGTYLIVFIGNLMFSSRKS